MCTRVPRHIACEELEKLPIPTVVAVSLTMKSQVDWTRIDRVCGATSPKSNRCLFIDSLTGLARPSRGTEAYDDDVTPLSLHGYEERQSPRLP